MPGSNGGHHCISATLEVLGKWTSSEQHAFPQVPKSGRSQSGGTQVSKALSRGNIADGAWKTDSRNLQLDGG